MRTDFKIDWGYIITEIDLDTCDLEIIEVFKDELVECGLIDCKEVGLVPLKSVVKRDLKRYKNHLLRTSKG